MKHGRNIVITSSAIALSMTLSVSAFGQADQKQLNLFEQHKDEYVQSKDPKLVEVGPAHYLVIEGQSAPEGEAFQQSVGALYSVAFTVKMTMQMREKKYYAVNPLEGLYWAEGKEHAEFQEVPREQWRFKLMIRVPEFIIEEHVKGAIAACEGRNEAIPHEQVELETIEEGTCVQVLHVGPYSEEGPNIQRMHDFAIEQGFELHGKHHEIYLGDPRTTPPEKLKTILRQPVQKKKKAGGTGP